MFFAGQTPKRLLKFQVLSNNPSGERYNEKKYRREYRQTTEILIDLRHTALTAP